MYPFGRTITAKLAGLILAALAVSSCSWKPDAVRSRVPSSDAIRSHPIFVVRHGWHTGLVIPAHDLNQAIPGLKEYYGDAAYYEVGWGDQEFYPSRNLSIGLTLQAIFRSEGAVMHVVAIPASPKTFFDSNEVISTCLTDQQVSALAAFVANSFARDQQGGIVRLMPGLYGNSRFFQGKGRFSLLHTCNNWTAKGLKSAGMKLSSTFSQTSLQVMSAIRELRQQCALPPNPTLKKMQRNQAAS
ncbi:TIGR02117 family protein [Synechococcus sp. CS-1324]|uniref:TIGR02117 family protein n=1 Tax=Synechococcus sp. CS-1324 TaxID=2847980 RepID=UPI000DB8E5A7|nr:TIGR02117 family protein [Synechococcus sp. CS-1324]MCT0230899.1 TIGR02117 family protein [Synechococcus sp. CS-1324]PZV04513.1 MAG: TIGR02117 family protein [Cyanobium sp.]